MKISDTLKQAWALIEPVGCHTQRAFARDAFMEVVHALHPDAVCWDSTGALQRVTGQLEGPQIDGALMCLGTGALRMKMGVLEVNDTGTRHQLEAMWSFAIATAENVERQLVRLYERAAAS